MIERFILDSGKTKNTNPIKKQNEVINNKFSNPIDNTKILPLSSKTSSNKLYSGYINSNIAKNETNYSDIINILNNVFNSSSDPVNLFRELYNQISEKLNINFSALGICEHNSNCINLILNDKNGSSYNSKILLNEIDNPIIQAYTSR